MREKDLSSWAGRPAGGFVLVGVVMFVLALTILGLTLFGLSSFEAQFLGNSRAEVQTFYDASSGIEWAKQILVVKQSLSALKDPALTRPANVVYVNAFRVVNPADSTGPLSLFPPDSIEIRVVADNGTGARAMLGARFLAQSLDTLYKHLISSSSTINVPVNFNGSPRGNQTFLNGSTWQNSADISWWSVARGLHFVDNVGGVPYPEVAAFISAHPAEAQAIGATYHLDLGGSGPHYYTSAPQGANYTVWDSNGGPKIRVRGLAVWMLPRGVRFENFVQLDGSVNDTLIIVAGGGTFNPGDPPTGIWFAAGFKTDNNDPVTYLVSDARVAIEYGGANNDGEKSRSTSLAYLSIFANGVVIAGPNADRGNTLTLAHPFPDPVAARLYTLGVLPNIAAGHAARFQAMAGSWRQFDATDEPD
ncbi:MAG: hypothetical protein A2W00_05410 [Candidatus Eisenbacteria bacterium RBG_16_71_46]|nr:MAG: hypothetical protein A2W00_05410 [Candidatus Eisenbacteria bacterium RBG_16_71_46]